MPEFKVVKQAAGQKVEAGKVEAAKLLKTTLESRRLVADYLVSELTAKLSGADLSEIVAKPGSVNLSVHWG